MSLFKACDIRGIAGQELTPEIARQIGNATVTVLKARTLTVGRDMRLSSDDLSASLVQGILEAGCSVYDLGRIPTEISYFAINHLQSDGGVMVTASHNPAEYNGMKICGLGAVPIDYDGGIGDIENLVANNKYVTSSSPGLVIQHSLLTAYTEHVFLMKPLIQPVKIVVDAGNGMAGLLMPYVVEKLPQVEVIPLFWELDGHFPNHGPNPMTPSSTQQLKKQVVDLKADFGIAFDGDADRIVFVDECGKLIKSDIILMLAAQVFLQQVPGCTIVYDLRCSKAVPESIIKQGGIPVESKVGHTNLKKAMREHNAMFAGELSGHYYFRENSYSDSSLIMLLRILEIVTRESIPFSKLVERYSCYYASGEISFKVNDQQKIIAEIAKYYATGKHSRLDGLTVRFENWWFNVRCSITEPYLRLNIEADTLKKLQEKTVELRTLIE